MTTTLQTICNNVEAVINGQPNMPPGRVVSGKVYGNQQAPTRVAILWKSNDGETECVHDYRLSDIEAQRLMHDIGRG